MNYLNNEIVYTQGILKTYWEKEILSPEDYKKIKSEIPTILSSSLKEKFPCSEIVK